MLFSFGKSSSWRSSIICVFWIIFHVRFCFLFVTITTDNCCQSDKRTHTRLTVGCLHNSLNCTSIRRYSLHISISVHLNFKRTKMRVCHFTKLYCFSLFVRPVRKKNNTISGWWWWYYYYHGYQFHSPFQLYTPTSACIYIGEHVLVYFTARSNVTKNGIANEINVPRLYPVQLSTNHVRRNQTANFHLQDLKART